MKAKIHFLIEGRVQGVGFRAFTKREADKLSLIGWVRNLRDGRVEGIALGKTESLEEFKKILQKGPHLSRVDSFKIENWAVSLDDKESDFKILQDGVHPCLEPLN